MAAKNKFMNAMKMPAIADMFSSEADRQRESGDLVTEVPLSELHPFVNHPFEVRDDEDILASSVLYELIGPACAKLSLYLSGSYSNRLDDIVTETVKCDEHEPENEVERLIRQIQAIQKELPAHNDPFLEDEQAYDEAAYEHYALTGYPQVSYQNTRRKADIWTL